MRPFLLLATRPEDAAADSEYRAFLRYGGLTERDLVRVRLDSAPMPPVSLADYSGIFVGGSPYTGSIPVEHKSDTQRRVEAELAGLLDVVVAEDYPFLGACYGVGTLGRHQGATIDGTYAENIGAPWIEVTDDGAADPLLAGMPRRFQAFVGHKEAMTSMPEGAVLLATSAACPVQMFRVKDNLYGTQFHPELDVTGLLERVQIYRDAGYFPPGEQEAVERACRDSQVDMPFRVLRNFVARYARD
ncbi:glutamine amidotransferase [Georgenia yuyongxinii]|uniref:Glutamine amidotransferase n=1 Tax=Georgenia yuyongxinii TaxID=2589797 RepID=A0A552WWQ0_9MICO|nr:glutamine amidotransferase [Georgenia yuyongxinii]TRW47222.1 glutamine amidotransferase [Georgenia yuyongxinii]